MHYVLFCRCKRKKDKENYMYLGKITGTNERPRMLVGEVLETNTHGTTYLHDVRTIMREEKLEIKCSRYDKFYNNMACKNFVLLPVFSVWT